MKVLTAIVALFAMLHTVVLAGAPVINDAGDVERATTVADERTPEDNLHRELSQPTEDWVEAEPDNMWNNDLDGEHFEDELWEVDDPEDEEENPDHRDLGYGYGGGYGRSSYGGSSSYNRGSYGSGHSSYSSGRGYSSYGSYGMGMGGMGMGGMGYGGYGGGGGGGRSYGGYSRTRYGGGGGGYGH
jgi:hypothetical protein